MSARFPGDRSKGDLRSSQHQDHSPRPTSGRITVPARAADTNATDQSLRSPNTPLQQSSTQHFFRVPASPRANPTDAPNVGAKVAIPRLKRDLDVADGTSGRGGARHRVNHACEPCRHRKTKCSGERPVCKHCQDFKIACFYADGKRDRVKKQFGTMSEKVAEYEKLLKDLIDRVPEDESRLIRASLDKAAQSEIDESIAETVMMPSIEVTSENEASGGAESEASAEAGSMGALDRTDEDFTREGARQTGFMGKNSGVTWMQRLKEENRFGDNPVVDNGKINQSPPGTATKLTPSKTAGDDDGVPLAEAVEGFTTHETSYHLDDLAITTFDAVDPYEMPTMETARALFSTYMHRVHPTFPVVGQVNLSSQFHRYLRNPMQRPPEKWLAIVNMIFAISAKYSHLVQAEWRSDERDHLIYFNRARLLAIDQDALFQHADLQQIQILGLMSFYLLCTSQMNRAWNLIGIAIRAACGMGLNMRNESTNLKESLKEIRYRLWWALYSLEHRLCSITGRVNCILDEHCTTPLPIPLDEDKFETVEGKNLLGKESQQHERVPAANSNSPSVQASTPSEPRSSSAKSETSRSSLPVAPPQHDLEWAKDAPPTSSLYFLHVVQLTRLTQYIFQRLYNPAAMEGSWSDTQSRIRELDASLESWYRLLPPIFDFRRKQRDREFYEFRLSLGFFYYGTKQVVNRPCLCRLDRKIPGQSAKSNEFNRMAAARCVEAAQDSLRLIPDEPNAVGLISVGPWWSILHWLVQSATVLMLEISFRSHHMPEEAEALLESSKKAIRWLHALGEDNESAARAWSLCNNLLTDAAKRIGREVKGLPQRPPRPSSISTEGTHMSGLPANNTGLDRNHLSQAQVAANSITNSMTMPAYQAFANYDNLMQYDQYFPTDTTGSMSLPGGYPAAYSNTTHDPEIDFMGAAYHDEQGLPGLGNASGLNSSGYPS